MQRRAKRTATLAGWALLSVSGPAAASGLSVARFGGEHGTPMTTEPTSIYYNPSGLASSEGGHVFGDLALAWRRATYRRSASDTAEPTGAEGANTGRATLFNVVTEPFVGGSYAFGNAALGAAFYVPFGGQNSWSDDGAFRGNTRYPGAVDGVQRWYTITGALRHMFFSVAGAYRFGPVGVGLSVNAIDTVVDTVQARTPGGDDDLRNEGRARLDAQSWDYSMGAGVSYEPSPKKLRFGLSYQSRPGFGGGIRADGTLHTLFAGKRSATHVAFTTDLPDVVRAGGAYRPSEKVELRLFGDYQRWSVLRQQCIMHASSNCDVAPDGSAARGSDVILNTLRNWNDTFGVRAGASYFPSPGLELLGGAGFSSKAVPDETLEPGLLDFDLVTAAVGSFVSLGSRVRLGTTYTQVIYFPRDTTGRSIHARQAVPSRSPDSGGKYTLALGLLNLTLDLRF